MTKPSITISINPSYFCNFDCHFCYLTQQQLGDKKLLDLAILEKKLFEIKKYFEVDCIDVYGGEIALLGQTYLENLLDIVSNDGIDINFITNLSVINPAFSDPRVNLSVSWEGDIRRKSKQVLENIIKVDKDINLLMLASEKMLKWSDEKLINIVKTLNSVQNIKSVEVKPYSTNQANQINISYSEYEEHIMKWLSLDKSFEFINEKKIKNVFNGTVNSFSDDHLYIDPIGEFNVLDFDSFDNEYFKRVSSVEEYLLWSNDEKMKVSKNSFCSKCPYLGSCLSEHLREVKDLSHSCNGYYNLIEWYRDRVHERI